MLFTALILKQRETLKDIPIRKYFKRCFRLMFKGKTSICFLSHLDPRSVCSHLRAWDSNNLQTTMVLLEKLFRRIPAPKKIVAINQTIMWRRPVQSSN